jgi:2-octaprenyl-6-methoxyphenol hydroxylase
MSIDTDILVIGGGMAGLALTARLGEAGIRVTCIHDGPMPTEDNAGDDQRTTAILMPGVETLRGTGAWDAIAPDAQPLHGMRIVDCGGADDAPRDEAMFDAVETGGDAFGWNVQNGLARLAMARRIAGQDSADLIADTRLDHWIARQDRVLATLSDGTRVSARLLVGADGRGSMVRAKSGIGLRKWGYAQKALACRVEHTKPHDGISIEMHHVGGPLTFAPLPGDRSGLVWMNADGEADRLAALDDAAFLAELNERSHGLYGEITAAAPRAVWPATTQVATGLTARRTVLLAEAAHAFPPIGAQGFNLSLRDVEALASLCAKADDPGGEALTKAYARQRTPDILARTAGVDILNRSVRTEVRALRDLRRMGLSVLGNTPPLRRLAMKIGMGT